MIMIFISIYHPSELQAWLAQSVEHETLNLRVVGSSPTLGVLLFKKKNWFLLIYAYVKKKKKTQKDN